MKTRRRKSKPAKEDPITAVEILEVDTQCPVCEAEFLDEEDLKIHVDQVHKQGLVLCKFCDTNLPGPEEFVTHFIRVHLDKVMVCSYCYRVFSHNVAYQQHEISHCVISKKHLSCSQCPKTFSRRQLQQHEYDMHRNSGDGAMLNNFFPLLSSALNMPVIKVFNAVTKKESFCCNMCNYFTRNVYDYLVHLRSMNCQSLVCDNCCKVFKNKRVLVSHFSKQPACQNASININATCPRCKKEFEPELLVEHKNICEAEKCSTCGVIFLSMNSLADHRIKEHSVPQSVSIHSCVFCKKEFVGEANLIKHIDRTHNNGKYKYRCSHCYALFLHPKRLFGHYFTKHKDIDPYTCKICNKTYRIRKKFTIHIKLDHNSVGFVEFDENLHVIFTDKKSEKPFQPEIPEGLYGDTEDVETAPQNIDSTETPQNSTETPQKDVADQIESMPTDDTTKPREFNIQVDVEEESSQVSNLSEMTDTHPLDSTSTKTLSSEELNVQKLTSITNTEDSGDMKQQLNSTKYKDKENKKNSPKSSKKLRKRKGKTPKGTPTKKAKKSVDLAKESSDDEPLSNIRDTIHKTQPQKRRKGMKYKTNKSKLTCKICSKYCYTYQNYQRHMSLHMKSKLKRCVKCLEYFKSSRDLQNHIESAHSSSKLTETLKSLLEKRKQTMNANNMTKQLPAVSLKQLIEDRKRAFKEEAQNTASNRFKRTIKKVDVSDNENHKAIITPMTDHGISVKKFIENFRPDGGDSVSISSSVTLKILNSPVEKQSFIKLKKMSLETPESGEKLRWPVKFKDSPINIKSNVSVKLVQELITKPKFLNFTIDERIPTIDPPQEKEYDEYCNTFADETDYTQYKNDAPIPEVAQEVMLAAEDIPRTKRLAQEIVIPNIPEEFGEVRIGHLLPQAPFFKIVKVKKLLKQEPTPVCQTELEEKKIKLPDGTKLVTVNPFSHLIPNNHLEEVLKANRNKYYRPRVGNIENALVNALSNLKNPRSRSKEYANRNKKIKEKKKLETASIKSVETTAEPDLAESAEAIVEATEVSTSVEPA